MGCYYISLPSLNNYHVVAIQPQHTITFCIVSNSLKYLYTFYYLYLFINDWVVIVFMPSLNKFGPFPCIWMPSTFVLLFLVSLEFSSANFRAYFIYVKYVFALFYNYFLEYSLGTWSFRALSFSFLLARFAFIIISHQLVFHGN